MEKEMDEEEMQDEGKTEESRQKQVKIVRQK